MIIIERKAKKAEELRRKMVKRDKTMKLTIINRLVLRLCKGQLKEGQCNYYSSWTFLKRELLGKNYEIFRGVYLVCGKPG